MKKFLRKALKVLLKILIYQISLILTLQSQRLGNQGLSNRGAQELGTQEPESESPLQFNNKLGLEKLKDDL